MKDLTKTVRCLFRTEVKRVSCQLQSQDLSHSRGREEARSWEGGWASPILCYTYMYCRTICLHFRNILAEAKKISTGVSRNFSDQSSGTLYSKIKLQFMSLRKLCSSHYLDEGTLHLNLSTTSRLLINKKKICYSNL